MEVPRWAREPFKSARYRLMGEVCPVCSGKIFPPRDICPYCRALTVEPKRSPALTEVQTDASAAQAVLGLATKK